MLHAARGEGKQVNGRAWAGFDKPTSHYQSELFFCHGRGRGEIARLLFVVDKIPRHERDRVRRDLLDYCHRDAMAMVRLVENLEGLARVAP
jgi:hypothetical protein